MNRRARWARRWRLAARIAPWLLAAAVLALLARQLHRVHWNEVGQALAALPLPALALALLLGLASHALFASYDLVGRHETRHRLPLLRTLALAATCYAFTLNFGSVVGSLALKLRLYTKAGLAPMTVARVILLTLATNWVGYGFVAGTVLMLAPPPLPAALPVSAGMLRAVGVLMLALALLYVALAHRRERPSLNVRGRSFTWPAGGVALWQLAVSAANWSLIGAIVWLLLQRQVDYPTVLGVFLLAAVTGALTHVPAGLGVIEAVFIACLGDQVPESALLAALLSYRAVYYLLPLGSAFAIYAASERGLRRAQPCGVADIRSQ